MRHGTPNAMKRHSSTDQSHMKLARIQNAKLPINTPNPTSIIPSKCSIIS